MQTLFRVVLRMAENPDWSRVPTVANRLQQLQVQIPFTQLQDLLPFTLAIVNHAVQVQRVEIRLHLLKQCREPAEVVMAVMQVVDDADIVEFQLLNDRNLILGLTKPTAMIVERQLAPHGGRRFSDRADSRRFRNNAGPLIDVILRGTTAAGDPELRCDLMLGEDSQGHLGFIVQRSRKPPRRQFQMMSLERFDLGIECRDMLGSIVVSKVREAQLLKHRRTLFRPSLLGVKRNNTPRHQILPGE